MKNHTLCSLSFKTTNNYEENLLTLLHLIAKTPKNSLIVAPEVCLTGFDYDNYEKALDFVKIAEQKIKKASKDKIIILTMLEKRDNKIFNFAKVFHNGKIVHQQAKARLFKFGDEHKYMQEGDDKDIKIIEINGIKIAILICFELRFKDLWKKAEGADVIATPSYWGVLRTKHFESITKTLAIINQCFVVASDSLNKDCTKMSGIIKPDGEVFRNGNKPCLKIDYNKKEIQKMRRYMDVGIG
jgi:predicted amidohydrolase